MPRLLTDIAGPFYDPAQPFRNWSALPFYQLDLPAPPYVDLAGLERGVARAEAYLIQVAAQGYTGVVVDNLAHLVSFDDAPARVYGPADPCRLRALVYGEAFGRLFAAAAARGMEVFVTTDMQWATPGLRRCAAPPFGRRAHAAAPRCVYNRASVGATPPAPPGPRAARRGSAARSYGGASAVLLRRAAHRA